MEASGYKKKQKGTRSKKAAVTQNLDHKISFCALFNSIHSHGTNYPHSEFKNFAPDFNPSAARYSSGDKQLNYHMGADEAYEPRGVD